MRITERIDLPVAPARAWGAVVEPRVVVRATPGLETFEAIDGGPLRVGSRIRALMRIGAAELGSELEVTVLNEGSDLGATSVTGIDLQVGLRVRPHGDGTRVTVHLACTPPGGVTGALAGAVVRPELRRRTRAMLRAIERLLLAEEPPATMPGPTAVAGRALRAVAVLGGAGALRPLRPDKVAVALGRLVAWGPTPAGAYAAAAVRDPHRLALVDGDRALTYAELEARTTALAVALRDRGVVEGHRVAIACRNHRGFVEALVATGKAGADALLVNTGFAAPQVRAVFDRERPTALVCDADLLDLMDDALGAGGSQVVSRVVSAWDAGHAPRSGVRALEELIVEGAGRSLAHPKAPGRVVLLTSGTTGVPKGTRRRRIGLDAAVSFLDRLPYRDGGTVLVAPPLFHAWGYANLIATLLLGGTVVLRRDADPDGLLRSAARHGADVLVAVPAHLRGILALGPEAREAHDVSRLRVAAVSGSPLPGDVARRWTAAYGPGLHAVYGATEVGWAAVAGPEDLRAAPGTAGRIPYGTDVRIFDEDGVPLPTHRVGRIHVRGPLTSQRYTDGTRLPQRDGLTDTGDLGYLDDLGRLHVLGRADDMVVAGGERLFPRAVEDVISGHPAVADVAVVPDPGGEERLVAHVVRAPGQTLSVEELRAHVAAQRPRAEVPADVRFLDALPRGATGKVAASDLPR